MTKPKHPPKSTPQRTRIEFVQEMIAKLQDFMLTSEPVISINVDGLSATFDRKGAWEMLKDLEQEEQRLNNPRRMMKNVDLRGAFG